MEVRIVASEKSGPEDKLADCELVFAEGILAGLKLVGFSIWRSRRGVLPVVTFPSRVFVLNGERRSYSLLRSEDGVGSKAQEPLRALIAQAFMEYEARTSEAVVEGNGREAVKDASRVEASDERGGEASADHGE